MGAEGEERWTDVPEMMVSKARFEEVQAELEECRRLSLGVAGRQRATVVKLEAERDDLAKLLDEAIDREKVLEADLERVQEVGDELASEVERRWSGPGGCDCPVCSAAKRWRALAEARERGTE